MVKNGHGFFRLYQERRAILCARANQAFDYTFLLHNCQCLIKICAYSRVTIKQTAVCEHLKGIFTYTRNKKGT